jgi:amino acid adenylation domain-containing protein/non-ribosomal peptide synthase protein (TIGR01720 family)
MTENPARANRQRLLDLLLNEQGYPRASPAVIPRADRAGVLPASFAQRRLWTVDRLGHRQDLYNAPLAYRVRGPLDVIALSDAFTRLVARHETLRTTFEQRAGGPVQVIRQPGPAALEVTPVGSLAEAHRLIRAEACAPFLLHRQPPLRLRLLELAPDDHILLITLHHIATDTWSLGVMFREISELYRGNTLEPLPVQYADFAAWQREIMSGDRARRDIEFWKAALAGAPTIYTVPTDRPRPATTDFAGTEHTFSIDPFATARLRTLAAEYDATLFMVLLAAFNVQLARYTGETDVVVSSPVAGRGRLELEPLIGFFVNTLIMRTDLSGDPTFIEALRRVRRTALDAYAHQGTPFDRVVEELVPDRHLGIQPLAQVSFQVFEPQRQSGPADLELVGVDIEVLQTSTGTSKFDLTVTLTTTDSGLSGNVEFATQLYDSATIRRFTDNFATIVAGIAVSPDRRISELPILAPAERARLLEDWNGTTGPPIAEYCLHDLIAQQAARLPDAAAVITEDGTLTYRQLDERANALAHHLRAWGARPDSVIGLCVERSIEAVVGMLAILKAGGAFLMLEADQPADRLRHMLVDAGATLVLAQERFAASVPRVDGVQLYVLERDVVETARSSDAAPPSGADPDTLAYAVFTSGSTGRPKCVATSHRGIVNFFAWCTSEHGLRVGDRMLQKAPFSFDVSVWEALWPLTAGATVIVARPGDQGDPKYLASLIQQQGVTTVHFVPSMLRAFVAEPAVAACSTLRRVICGGEAMSTDLVRSFYSTLPQVALHNQYGPAEVSVQTVGGLLDPAADQVSLGHGVWNTGLYVLDQLGNPVPQGVAGELHLTGVQLARGYLNQPGLTADRFRPDPFGGPGARMYRTGDVVRWLADGTLRYVGRTDHQVKLRGYRIELGEIREGLLAHPDVRQAAAAVGTAPSGSPRLVGYVVPRDGAAENLDAVLRGHLARLLPGYMVPALIVLVDALPLNANGKVDLARLPQPAVEERPAAVSPRTREERLLSDIWGAVLGVPDIGVHDNFFSLGGDSIRAIDLAARAEAAGLYLRPAMLFQHQTLAELAANVLPACQPGDIASSADQGEVTGPAPLSPIQRAFLAVGDPTLHHLTQYVVLEVVADELTPEMIGIALNHLVRHHDALRLRLTRNGDDWGQVIDPDRPSTRLSRVSSAVDDMEAVVAEHAPRLDRRLNPLDGSMLAATLVDRPASPPVLLVSIHHLSVDAVSWRVLLEDLEQLCAQLAAGVDVDLPAKTTSFPAWTDALVAFAETAEAAAEARAWRAALPRDIPPLPRDRRADAGHGRDVGHVEQTLSEAVTRALLEDVPAVFRTQVNDLLLSALALAFHRWGGLTRVLVDLEGHGREPWADGVDLTRTVGWFTSIFPVCLELPDPSDLECCLTAVKETLRSVPGRGLGYGLLRYLRTDTGLADLPAADVLFNYLGQVELGGGRLFRQAAEPLRAGMAPDRPRTHLIEVCAQVLAGRLVVRWQYSRKAHAASSVIGLAEHYLAALTDIVEFCRRPDSGARTASDFPLSGLTTRALKTQLGTGRGVEDLYPLSSLQEGILFHTLTAANTDMYLTQVSWELGDVDPDQMAAAWQEVTLRTPVLRTRLLWKSLYPPLQAVESDARLPIRRLDWSVLGPEAQKEALEAFLEDGRRDGFDLTRAPIARLTLVRTAATSWRAVFETHHIMFDGWSIVLLIGDVLAVYRSLVSGTELCLPPRRRFRDYIEWQSGLDASEGKEFWTRYLAGFKEATPLPFEAGASAGAGVGVREIGLAADLGDRLDHVVRGLGVTASTVAHAAWALVLAGSSGQHDVVFGSTVSGRTSMPGMAGMIGLFINTLPVRVSVPYDRKVADWLLDLHRDRAEVPSEAMPLANISGWSEVPARQPLFSSIVVFGNYPVEESVRSALGGMSARFLRVREMNNFPLSLVFTPGPSLEAEIQYDRGLLSSATVDMLADAVATILEKVIERPGSSVSELLTSWS